MKKNIFITEGQLRWINDMMNESKKDIDFSEVNNIGDDNSYDAKLCGEPSNEEEEFINHIASLTYDAGSLIREMLDILATDEFAVKNKEKYSLLNDKVKSISDSITEMLDGKYY